MMGSCGLSLLLVALLPPVRITPAYCQHTEDHRLTFLVAIKSNGSGLEIHTRFLENHGYEGIRSQPELKSKMHFIPNHSLSSKCGDQYFRCQQLLIEPLSIQNTSGGVNNTIFVPLENGILLLSCWYDSNNMTIEKRSFIMNTLHCSPTLFYKISSKIYTVCINSTYFDVYEVQLQLNGSVIENAFLIGPLTQIHIIYNSSNYSNFVLIERKVYFAVHNHITVMGLLDKTESQTYIYPEIQDCTQIHRLATFCTSDESESQQFLLAYCVDKYSCYDLNNYQDWCDQQSFSREGIPYLCPDNIFRTTLFVNSALQFSRGTSILNTINNVNISSGICFKSQNETYFAYSDQQHNYIYVYDFTTQNHYPVSPYDCSHVHQDCPQLLILENDYLAIHDAIHNLVFDTTTNFSLIINISSGIADILAILHSNVYSAIIPSHPNIHSTTTKVPPAPVTVHNNLVVIISTAIIGFFVFVVTVILVTITIAFSIQHWRRKRGKSAYRIPRLRLITSHRHRPLLVAESAQEEEEEEEEESESYEMESMMEPQHFGKGWRWTTEV